MARKTLIAGNWKMNKTLTETKEFFNEFLPDLDFDSDKIEIAIAPAFTSLQGAIELTKDSAVTICAQNCSFENNGAFTGEVSTLMLSDLGCKYVIIGHSERRAMYYESNTQVNKKVLKAINDNLVPILCIGETLAERKSDQLFDILGIQIEKGLEGVSIDNDIVIAYEPVWAIGTGLTATPEEAEEVHIFIRDVIAELFSQDFADKTQIIYGGSVKPDNTKDLLTKPNIDGALIGGASLNPSDLKKIIDLSG